MIALTGHEFRFLLSHLYSPFNAQVARCKGCDAAYYFDRENGLDYVIKNWLNMLGEMEHAPGCVVATLHRKLEKAKENENLHRSIS